MNDIGKKIEAIPYFSGKVRWEPLTGGLSNESFVATHQGKRYVVRFGSDYPFHHVDREREINFARAAHLAGFAPDVVYSEPGIMVSRFIDARTFDENDVCNNIDRIASIVSEFHTTMAEHISGPGYIFWVFHVIRDYARTLERGKSPMQSRLPEFLALAKEMEQAQMAQPIIFGHHDLLPANFLDDGSRLWLIDFEYAGFSTPMFDLAGIASNAGFNVDQADELLIEYYGSQPSRELRRSHVAMQCASLLREAMWSMVSQLYLTTSGVDFGDYANQNLNRLDKAIAAYRSQFGKD